MSKSARITTHILAPATDKMPARWFCKMDALHVFHDWPHGNVAVEVRGWQESNCQACRELYLSLRAIYDRNGDGAI